MAPCPPPLPMAAILLLVILLVRAGSATDPAPPTGDRRGLPHYARAFCFGNSLTDTGNAAIFPLTAGGAFTRPPYGETHFGHPSGRASDGRLVIDFLVEELKVPQPTPYLAGGTAADDFLNGTNFAVGGATALDPAFLASKGIASFGPISLSNETAWFQNVVQLLDSSGYERRKITASSIFFVGEIGVNDYFFALINHPVDVVASLVPHIIGTIRSALTAMVSAGATTVVTTGMLPLGCEPQLLALFPGDYDPATGCVARFNALAELHNRALRRMLRDLRRVHPGRSFLYADAYRPVVGAVTSPAKYGFGDAPLAACCGGGGGGGPYNFDFAAFCGTPGSTACADPSKFVSWDGIHFTEAANRLIARAMLRELRCACAGRHAIAVAGAPCDCASTSLVSPVR